MEAQQLDYYQAGGSLPYDAQSYVKRKADDDLYRHLKEGKFCYVLTARQMGKSSLRVQTMKRFEKEGYACVAIDMTQMGSQNVTPEQWYNSFLNNLSRGLNLRTKYNTWKTSTEGLTPVHRFVLFTETFLLTEITRPIILFIDEIDSVLSLDPNQFSTDDFFAAIRSFYNARADRPEFRRLNFALFGVAAPDDLMKDQTRTPFNIGEAIPLENFTLFEARESLLKGLERVPASEEALLKEVFKYTNGQPYLTQTICAHLLRKKRIEDEDEAVRQVVDDLFFNTQANEVDHNLSNINNRIMQNEAYNLKMLQLYQAVRNKQLIRVNRTDPAQIYLRLSGLVLERDGFLQVSNTIYERYFNHQWLSQAFDKIERPFANDLQRWLDSNKSSAAALRGEVLAKALVWKRGREDVSDLEREFIEYSVEVEHQEQIKAERAAHASVLKMRNRFLRLLLVIALALLIIASHQWNLSKEKSDELEQKNRELDNRAQKLKISTKELETQTALLTAKTQELAKTQPWKDSIQRVYKDYSLTLQANLQASEALLKENKKQITVLRRQIAVLQKQASRLSTDTSSMIIALRRLYVDKEKLQKQNDQLEKEISEFRQSQLTQYIDELKKELLTKSFVLTGIQQGGIRSRLNLGNTSLAKAKDIQKLGIQFSTKVDGESDGVSYQFILQYVSYDNSAFPQVVLNEILKSDVINGKVVHDFEVKHLKRGIYILAVSNISKPLIRMDYYFRLD